MILASWHTFNLKNAQQRDGMIHTHTISFLHATISCLTRQLMMAAPAKAHCQLPRGFARKKKNYASNSKGIVLIENRFIRDRKEKHPLSQASSSRMDSGSDPILLPSVHHTAGKARARICLLRSLHGRSEKRLHIRDAD